MPARQPLEMQRRYRFHSTRPAPWKRVSVAANVDRQSKGGVNFKRPFSNSRLWPEVEPSQLVQLIGVIVEGIVQGFGKNTGDFGLGLLIAFDQFASVEPSISNVVELLFADALEGRTLKHCLFDDVLVHRYLLAGPRSFQCV
jgi:hypothetical protein